MAFPLLFNFCELNYTLSVAWDYFGIENGTKDFEEFDVRLKRYRIKNNITSFPDVGCIVLNAPFYLEITYN